MLLFSNIAYLDRLLILISSTLATKVKEELPGASLVKRLIVTANSEFNKCVSFAVINQPLNLTGIKNVE